MFQHYQNIPAGTPEDKRLDSMGVGAVGCGRRGWVADEGRGDEGAGRGDERWT